jgi:GNAT superfamily N-acetyltransferase
MERETMDLTGLWRCQPDPFQEGEARGYWRPEHDVRLWREVAVPSTFEKVAPGMETYEGTVWYRTCFEVPAGWAGRRVTLRFEGVNYHARAWLNGQEAGRHGEPFLPFEMDLTGLVRCGGRNVLVTAVENERRAGDVPGRERGWRAYGGILRPVSLAATDPLRIAHVAITAEPDGEGGALRATLLLRNDRTEAAEAQVALEIGDAGGEVASLTAEPVSLEPGEERQLALEGSVPEARTWYPESPVLYTATARLDCAGSPVDAVESRFGFRRIEVRAGELLLNGERVFLAGFNRHEDCPQTNAVPDLEVVRRDLESMKEANANFVRLCHYPHDRRELDLCDELGLLAMGEIPLYWWSGLEEGEECCAGKLEAAKGQLAAMIRRDINHPSLVFWSVSNETQEGRPEVAAGNRELIRLARELDPSRLAVHVSDKWQGGGADFAEDDVVCVNAYPTWFGDRRVEPEEMLARSTRKWREALAELHRQQPGKPVLVTEFGYPCFAGVRGCGIGWGMPRRAIEAEFAGMDAPHVCGATIWCWADHPWPEEPFLRYVTTSPFGVLTRRRRRLPGYEAARRLFGRRRGKREEAGPAGGPGPAGHPVDMIRPHLRDIPPVDFPDGFGIRTMRPDEAGLWADVQRDAEPFMDDITEGLFYAEFGTDLPATTRRCFFIVNERGAAVGTISAWYDRDYKGRDYGRIHWVAVRPAFQRLGLAKAGLSHAMRCLARWHERAYLSTQTRRLPAIRLYLDFGFVPDLEPPGAREAWREVRAALEHPALEGLEL